MDTKSCIGAALIACIILVSIPFEKRYTHKLNELAHNPAVRFCSGLLLVALATYDILLGAMALLIVFFWFADIDLISSLKLK
jgi:hypothetical protein